MITYFFQDLRDCRQISFVTLNGFCLLRKKTTPLFLIGNIKMERILTNIFFIVFQVLKVLLIKICNGYSHQIFYFLLFLLALASVDIISHKFSELHSTLSEKKIFVTNFPFLTDSLKPPSQQPKSAKRNKSLVNAPSRLLCYDEGQEELEQQSRTNTSIQL